MRSKPGNRVVPPLHVEQPFYCCFVIAVADDFSRNTAHDGIGWHIFRDSGVGKHYGSVGNVNATIDEYPLAYPYIIPYLAIKRAFVVCGFDFVQHLLGSEGGSVLLTKGEKARRSGGKRCLERVDAGVANHVVGDGTKAAYFGR